MSHCSLHTALDSRICSSISYVWSKLFLKLKNLTHHNILNCSVPCGDGRGLAGFAAGESGWRQAVSKQVNCRTKMNYKMTYNTCWTWEQNSTPWGRLSVENLLQAQGQQSLLYNGGPDYVNLHWEKKYLYCFLRLALNYSLSGKDPFRSQLWGNSYRQEQGTSDLPPQWNQWC